MIKIRQAIIVEGKYDKIKLSSIIDAPIITTGGFSIFNDKQKQRFIRDLAEKRGIVILTDSDNAGMLIRNKLCSMIDKRYIINAYIPQLSGKEKRKTSYSKQGLLGVEGIDKNVILSSLKRAGVEAEDDGAKPSSNPITKTDFYFYGLTGTYNSLPKRTKLLKLLQLPDNLSTDAMIEAINIFLTREEFEEKLREIE